MRMPMTLARCARSPTLPSGKPVIVLHGVLEEWFEAQGLTAHVTVTDETDYAASFVVVEKGASMNDAVHAPLILDIAGTALNAADRRRLAAPAGRRHDPVRPQLAGPRAS